MLSLLKFFGKKIQYLFSCNVYASLTFDNLHRLKAKNRRRFYVNWQFEEEVILWEIFETYLTPGISKN
jgi:hypothetical protein